jgi:hypothetical protein
VPPRRRAIGLLILLLILVPTLPVAFAAETFNDGFESGDWSGWSAGTPVTSGTYTAEVIAGAANSGSYGGHFAGSASGYAYISDTEADAGATSYFRFYYRWNSITTSADICYIRGASGIVTYLSQYADGRIRLYTRTGASYLNAYSTTTLTEDTWYCIEIETIVDGTNGYAYVWINGVQEASCNLGPTDNNDYGNIITFRVGVLYTGASTAIDVHIDRCIASTTYIGTGTFTGAASQSVTWGGSAARDMSWVTRNDYVDNDSSDVDATADIGTASTFNNQKATDSTYDTLTEADSDSGTSTFGDSSGSGTSYRTTAANEVRLYAVSAGSTGEVASIVFYGRGSSATNAKAIICDSSGNLLTNGVGDAVAVSTTAGTKTLTFSAGSRPLVVSGTTYWIGFISQAAIRLYYDSTTGATSKQDTSNSYSTPTSPTDAGSTTETWRLMYANVNNINGRLNYEEQFTDVPYDAATVNLCVKTGAFSGDTLKLYQWFTGNSTWGVVSASLTASSWNNFTVTPSESTYTIKFEDNTQTNDNTLSTFQVDATMLYVLDANLFSGAVTQSIDFTGNAAKALVMLKGVTQTIDYAGNAAKSLIMLKSVTQTIDYTGNAVRMFETIKTAAQAIDYTGNAAKTLILLKEVAQALDFTGNAAKTLILLKGATQVIDFTGDAARLLDIIRSAAQNVDFSGNAAKLSAFISTASQSIDFSGNAARLGDWMRSAAQSITSTWSALSEFISGSEEYLADASIAISTALNAARLGEWMRSTSQTVSFASSSATLFAWMRGASQALTLSVSASRLIEATRNVAQSFTISLNAAHLIEYVKAATQSFVLGSAAAKALDLLKNVSQIVDFSGASAKLIEVGIIVSQVLDYAGNAMRVAEYLRATAQGLVFSSTVQSLAWFGRGVTQAIIFAASALRGIDVSIVVTQVISFLNDAAAVFTPSATTFIRAASQVIPFASSAARGLDVIRVASEAISFISTGLGWLNVELVVAASMTVKFFNMATNLSLGGAGISYWLLVVGAAVVIFFAMMRRR